MKTRRSWRNQDRLYRAIGRDLQRAATEAAAAAPSIEQNTLPGDVGAVRNTENPSPALADAPFALRASVWVPKSKQGDLF